MSKSDFLIYHTGALGDFITILPALSCLKKQYQNHRFILLGKPFVSTIALENGIVDEVWDIDRAVFAGLYSSGMPDRSLIMMFKTVAKALLFTSSDSPIITALEKAGVQEIYQIDPFPGHAQAALAHLDSVKTKFNIIDSESYYLKLYAQKSSCHDSDSADEKMIAIHPGSGSNLKNWPLDNYCEIRNRLVASGFTVIWFLGPAEQSTVIPFDDWVASRLSWRNCAEILHRCLLFVGNDSGMAHFAAAVGRPVLAVFGPSDWRVWKPYGSKVEICVSNRSCVPCHQTGRASTACKRACLSDRTVNDVYAKVLSMLF